MNATGEKGQADMSGSYLDRLKTGVAVADIEDLALVYENAAFARWFARGEDEGGDDTLPGRLRGVDFDRVRERLGRGRPFQFETEVRVGPRTVGLAIELRPDGDRVIAECRDITKQREAEYMLDSYARMAERNARELSKEKERAEKLLLNVMPRSVYEEMKDFGTAMPQRFEAASVLMLDFVGFTDMAATAEPTALIAELNDIFTAFDRIVEMFGCERLKTVGDAYLAVSGLPEPSSDHAVNIARVALRMRRYLERRNASHSKPWRCRMGIATGPMVGSLVGIQKYVYDVFGDPMNLASRLEEQSGPMEITVCSATHAAIRDDFILLDRGEVELKGFGPQRIFELRDEAARRAL